MAWQVLTLSELNKMPKNEIVAFSHKCSSLNNIIITETNKEKRLKWCEERQQTNDLQFSDVIFTDEL